MYIVGTPMNSVTLSSAIIRSASAPSKRGSRSRQAPPATPAFIEQVWPKEWNSGSPPKITSSVPMSNSVSTVVRTLVRMLSWLSSAPLGRPVVPEG